MTVPRVRIAEYSEDVGEGDVVIVFSGYSPGGTEQPLCGIVQSVGFRRV